MKDKLKHFLGTAFAALSLLLAGSFARTASAQESASFGADTLKQNLRPVVDSTLLGVSIFDILPTKAKGARADVTVRQSNQVAMAFRTQIGKNSSRKISGYRVRIYFDNQQNSRQMGMGARNRFINLYPEIPAYIVYQAPFFKVTVGDFRTKSEAMELLRSIRGEFPTAFVVKENINYPDPDPKAGVSTPSI